MKRWMHVTCNGKTQHVNRIDVETLLARETVYKGQELAPISLDDIPEHFNKKCDYCDARVCMNREMVNDFLTSRPEEA